MTKSSFWVVATVLLALTQAGAKTVPQAERAKRTLQEVRELSSQAASEAAKLKVMALNPELDSLAQAQDLTQLKDEINQIGRDLGTIQAEEPVLPAWEQNAVEQVAPLFKGSATSATTAIESMNANRSHLWASAPYRESTQRIYQDCERAAKILGESIKMAKLRGEEQRLNQSLTASGTR